LNTELSTKNKIQATGSLAVSVLRYSFGIINWHQEELQILDIYTRKLLTIQGQHHPKADVDHLYVPRKQAGRESIQIQAYMLEVMILMEYEEKKADPLIQTVRTHQHKKNLTILQNARNIKEKLQKGTRQMKDIITEKKKKERNMAKKKDA
jgi:hypothetical protein